MKTRILIYLFLFRYFFVFGLNNQETIKDEKTKKFNVNQPVDSVSYFGNNSCWTYKAKLYEYSFQIYRTTSVNGSIQGDTVINKHKYQLFNFQTGTSNSSGTSLIRQENKRIYMLSTNNQEEYLLYDFNVKKGDTIHSTAQGGYISRLPIVTDVDTVQLYNGEYRKRIKIFSDIWIEGIGSIYGFDYPTKDFVTCDCNSSFELISFAREKTLTFYNSELCASFNCCQGVIEDIKNIEEQKKIFDINPNPTKEIITIKFASYIENSNFELFDLQGNIVFKEKIHETNNSFYLNQLSNGIYFYRISTDGKLLQKGKLWKE